MSSAFDSSSLLFVGVTLGLGKLGCGWLATFGEAACWALGFACVVVGGWVQLLGCRLVLEAEGGAVERRGGDWRAAGGQVRLVTGGWLFTMALLGCHPG